MLNLCGGSRSRGWGHRSRVGGLDMEGHELESLGNSGAFCGCDKVAVGGVTVDWGRGRHFDKAPFTCGFFCQSLRSIKA